MAKRFMKLSVLLLVVVFASTGFSAKKAETFSSSMFKLNVIGELAYVPDIIDLDMSPHQNVPFVGKSYLGFCEDLGFSESSGNYRAVNRLGYAGKYQFGRSALDWVGIRSRSKFLQSPLLQEKAFETLISLNKWVLRDYIAAYDGQVINGVKVTESGLIAAAHLGGAENVKRFLETNGDNIFADANNVPITKYMMKFAHYDLSSILPDPNAKVTL